MSKRLIAMIPTHGRTSEQIHQDVVEAIEQDKLAQERQRLVQEVEDPLASIQMSPEHLRAAEERLKNPMSVEEMRESMLRQGLAGDVVRARRFAAENKKAAEEFCDRHGISMPELIDHLAAKNPQEWNWMLEEYEFQQQIWVPHDEYARDHDVPENDHLPSVGRQPPPESEKP